MLSDRNGSNSIIFNNNAIKCHKFAFIFWSLREKRDKNYSQIMSPLSPPASESGGVMSPPGPMVAPPMTGCVQCCLLHHRSESCTQQLVPNYQSFTVCEQLTAHFPVLNCTFMNFNHSWTTTARYFKACEYSTMY